MEDPIERRLAIVRLHSEGWNVKSIAAYLQTTRRRVYETLQRWVEEGVQGMDDKLPVPKQPARKVDLRTMRTVQTLQENPELGAFRIHAALKQAGIELSPRTCGRILALNRSLYGMKGPTTEPHDKKPMPFEATRRHQYWTVDVRYLDMHQLGGGMIYGISILENYSRCMLASMLSRSQDLTAYLMVLYAAIRRYGSPEALVSDGGGIFKANQAMAIYQALGIKKEQIDKRQAWQSYIESNFNVQRRMADWHFARARSWEQLLAVHDRWLEDFNTQEHWAHRERDNERRSPAAVLGWVTGTKYTAEELHRVFYTTRFSRRLDKLGYVRFRHWQLYGEQGVAGDRAAVWLYGLRMWVEQSYKQTKGALGWSDYQVRADRAIRRHWALVCCAFSFCWYHHSRSAASADLGTEPVADEATGGKKNQQHATTPAAPLLAGDTASGARLAGALDHAVALLERVVASAPTTPTPSAA
jgi:transposase